MTLAPYSAHHVGIKCSPPRHPWMGAVLCSLVLGPLGAAMAQIADVRVVRVVDGDTVLVRDAQSLNSKVRLHAIDAPECGMPDGPQAQAFLEQLVLGRTVQTETKGRDRYRRTVAILSMDGQDVGLTMISAGWAWHDGRFGARLHSAATKPYGAAQSAAQGKADGLWADDKPDAPWRWRAEGNKTDSSNRCRGRSSTKGLQR